MIPSSILNCIYLAIREYLYHLHSTCLCLIGRICTSTKVNAWCPQSNLIPTIASCQRYLDHRNDSLFFGKVGILNNHDRFASSTVWVHADIYKSMLKLQIALSSPYSYRVGMDIINMFRSFITKRFNFHVEVTSTNLWTFQNSSWRREIGIPNPLILPTYQVEKA